jgi:hypothetical protein
MSRLDNLLNKSRTSQKNLEIENRRKSREYDAWKNDFFDPFVKDFCRRGFDLFAVKMVPLITEVLNSNEIRSRGGHIGNTSEKICILDTRGRYTSTSHYLNSELSNIGYFEDASYHRNFYPDIQRRIYNGMRNLSRVELSRVLQYSIRQGVMWDRVSFGAINNAIYFEYTASGVLEIEFGFFAFRNPKVLKKSFDTNQDNWEDLVFEAIGYAVFYKMTSRDYRT